MGVPVPVIEKKRISKSVPERGYSIIGVSGRIDETAEKFEMGPDLIIGFAETETALKRPGGEIQMTRRRVNALEQVLIPDLKKQAKYIENTIDEREREDLFRLKKGTKDYRTQEKEGIFLSTERGSVSRFLTLRSIPSGCCRSHRSQSLLVYFYSLPHFQSL